MMGIYKITNTVSKSIYIGLSNDIKNRFYEHKRCSSNVNLKKAMDEFGVDMFTFEIIEEIKNEDELCARETFWINHYKEIGYNLYNVAKTKDNEEYKRQTYFLTEELIQALSFKSVFDKMDKSEIVREAIRTYVEDKYMNLC